jgi:putative membrane protein
MLVAAPLLALDQIGVELQNPFSTSNLSHLPLDDISAGIERNLLAALQMKQADAIAAVRNTGLPPV